MAPNLAELEVAKRNQDSEKEPTMNETTPSPLGMSSRLMMSGLRTTSTGWCGAAWRRR